MAKAEAEVYESQIEERLRRSGRDERELIEHGTAFGERVAASLERAILDIYYRHKQHIWIEHSVNHAEIALERAGLFEKVPRPPAICFVDLTGYTRLTEERGDEFAAGLVSNLASSRASPVAGADDRSAGSGTEACSTGDVECKDR